MAKSRPSATLALFFGGVPRQFGTGRHGRAAVKGRLGLGLAGWRLWGAIGLTAVCGYGLLGGFSQAEPPALNLKQGENGGQGQVVLVSNQKQIWIACRAIGANQSLPEGFCERLRTGFAQTTGQEVSAAAVVPDGAKGVIVELDQTNSHRAGVTLIVGQGQNGAFVEDRRQEMRLGASDAPLGAGSAQALVYPIVSLLQATP